MTIGAKRQPSLLSNPMLVVIGRAVWGCTMRTRLLSILLAGKGLPQMEADMGNSASPRPPQDLVPADFVALAKRWYPSLTVKLFTFVWQGYDLLAEELPAGIDERDLERSITQSLELRIRRIMSGDEPFVIQHGPYERETMQTPPAQPPQYDLAFILRADERIMWPLEATVLETASAV